MKRPEKFTVDELKQILIDRSFKNDSDSLVICMLITDLIEHKCKFESLSQGLQSLMKENDI